MTEKHPLDLLKRLIAEHPGASEEEIRFLFVEQSMQDAAVSRQPGAKKDEEPS